MDRLLCLIEMNMLVLSTVYWGYITLTTRGVALTVLAISYFQPHHSPDDFFLITSPFPTFEPNSPPYARNEIT